MVWFIREMIIPWIFFSNSPKCKTLNGISKEKNIPLENDLLLLHPWTYRLRKQKSRSFLPSELPLPVTLLRGRAGTLVRTWLSKSMFCVKNREQWTVFGLSYLVVGVRGKPWTAWGCLFPQPCGILLYVTITLSGHMCDQDNLAPRGKETLRNTTKQAWVSFWKKHLTECGMHITNIKNQTQKLNLSNPETWNTFQ